MNEDQTAVLIDLIRHQAPGYYPGFVPEQTCVQLLDKQRRSTAMLYRFRLSNKIQVRSVFVKVPFCNSEGNQTRASICEKPLLFPKTETGERHWLQYTALMAIAQYFTSLHKKQFGSIRVLDYLPECHAIVTEEVGDPQLRQLLLRASRLCSPFYPDKLTAAFQNAGTWLHLYHTMPKRENIRVRHQYRQDYVEAITVLTDFLAKILGDKSFFEETASIVINKGQQALPVSLPLGLGHGDYAPRNILIGTDARVTVLDTFAKWRTPIYEDIGYFLTQLKLCSAQVISQGLAFSSDQLAAYEAAFLGGYFGNEPIPYPSIQLYEVLALLDKWSNTVAGFRQQTILFKPIGQLGTVLVSQYFRREAKVLLREILKAWEDGQASTEIIPRKSRPAAAK